MAAMTRMFLSFIILTALLITPSDASKGKASSKGKKSGKASLSPSSRSTPSSCLLPKNRRELSYTYSYNEYSSSYGEDDGDGSGDGSGDGDGENEGYGNSDGKGMGKGSGKGMGKGSGKGMGSGKGNSMGMFNSNGNGKGKSMGMFNGNGNGNSMGMGMGMGRFMGKGKGGTSSGGSFNTPTGVDDTQGRTSPTDFSGLTDFETSVYITYEGPQTPYDVSNFDAINYLQDSIRDTYNAEIGCDMGLEASAILLLNQTMAQVLNFPSRKLQFGSTFSLVNFYKVSGKCRNCGTRPRAVNQAARRILEAGLNRQLQGGGGVAGFNTQIVIVLNQREEYSDVRRASISNDAPKTSSDESEDFLTDLNTEITEAMQFLETEVVTNP